MNSRTGTRWLLLFAGWSAFGGVGALMDTVVMSATGAGTITFFLYYLPLAWVWAALTPAIGWWSRVVAERISSRWLRMVAHVPPLLVATVIHSVARRDLVQVFGGMPRVPFEATMLYFADLTIVSYLAAVWAARTLDAMDRLRDRERQTQELQTQLAAAQLEYLELQLRPHFLFNALSTVAELAHEAPENAARMLRNVISLLQGAVARHGRGLVTLDDELLALQPYLAIQRARFADWITIETDASPDARRAAVPQLILQPLVENAVHHGLRGRSASGRIVIRARVENERLRVEVIDNGVGLEGSRYRERRGLGLSNLRARLTTVYGDAAQLHLGHDPFEGTAAVLDLPLRQADAVAVPASTAAPPVPADPPPVSESFDRLRGRMQSHPAVAIAVIWCAVAVLRTQHSFWYLNLRHRYTAEAFIAAIQYDAAAALVWIAMTPVVLWLARRIPIHGPRLWLNASIHLGGAFGVALAHTAATRAIARDFRYPLFSPASNELYAWNVSVYVIVVIFAHVGYLERWVREKDVAAERLRTELHTAQFNRVMLELRPAVLLDTLTHLVDLVRHDPRRAEKVLADVGSFLRATLDGINEPYVPLRHEANSAAEYARVLGVAAVPEMALELSIPVYLLDHPVPNGSLRSAVDRLLERGTRPGMVVHVRAALDDSGIVFHVEDALGEVDVHVHSEPRTSVMSSSIGAGLVRVVAFALCASQALSAQTQQSKPSYPVAPRSLGESEEISLAVSAAPEEVSGLADVYVLRGTEYVKARAGTNGCACMVGRDLHDGSLYPICFDQEGAKTSLWREIKAGTLRAQGRSEDEVRRAVDAAFASGELRLPAKASMAYMMSPRQVLFSSPDADGVRVGAWSPHVMLMLPGVPPSQLGLTDRSRVGVIQIHKSGERHAELIVKVPTWSDGGSASAPRDDPVMTSLRSLHRPIRRNLLQTAQQVPESLYDFRPAPEARSIGQLIGHVTNTHYNFCAAALGESRPASENFENVRGKTALVAALTASLEYCDRAYATIADTAASQTVTMFGTKVARSYPLTYNVAHDNEHYGNLVSYMRLNGIVPPSSNRSP